jgi:hypothetical protein
MNSKVIPFRSGQNQQPPDEPTKKPRVRRAKRRGLLLAESDEFDGFSALDLVTGLHGVCTALDQLAGSEQSLDQFAELSSAAKILSSIVQNRVEQ